MPTGRIQVAPGETIQSAEWGNPLWDHSVQCFASAADRANQFPAPQPGAMSFTEDTKTLWVYAGGVWNPVQYGAAAASGTATLSLPTAQAANTLAITFPAGRFTAPPSVTVNRSTNVGWASLPIFYWAASITATGFVLSGVSAAAGGAATLNWTAVQAP